MKYFRGLIIAILASTVTAKCGKGYGSCSGGKCCSKYGYCGTTDAYCGTGCQSSFGHCNGSSTSSPSPSYTVSTNGRCGKEFGTSCPNKECCSKYGYCGTSDKHCDAGCQSGFGRCGSGSTSSSPSPSPSSTVSTNGRCGKEFGTSCPNKECCSKYGYCGTSDQHCDAGCQSGFGRCSSSSTSSSPSPTPSSVSTNGRCGKEFGTSCPNNECCSKYGYCGTSDKHCDADCQTGFGKCNSSGGSNTSLPVSTTGLCGKSHGICPNHQCCSKYGYCGSKDDYCMVDKGCQSEFGRCGEYNSELPFKFYYKCKNSKHWALSFDDGPYEYDLDLLDLLKEKGVKATFFINGDNVMSINSSKGQKIVKRMYKEGHVIGSHTWSHANLEEISKDEIKTEMTKLEDAIYKLIGKKPALMRPPFGDGDGNDEIAEILGNLGYTAGCIWNVDTLDWDKAGDVDYALKVFKGQLGNPIMSLNHCYYKEITKEKLLTLTEEEIDYMLDHGYTPVTMDVCLGLDAYQN